MGIQNLLPFIKKACRQGDIMEMKGCSLAVDVSCLLHRGLFGCMEQMAQGQDTNFYIYYVNKYIKVLLELGCHVIMVFDGRPLPAKKSTNDERRQRRAENLRAGEVLLSEGKKEEALDKFKRATSITAEIVENTIQHFRSRTGIDVIVSPYESDAQLTFLTKEGLADAVITEDSDLVAFGCEKIIFKWNCDSGQCTIYEKTELPKCFNGVMASQFDFNKFRRICIMAGCDYLQAGLPGVGLNKALTFFSKTSQTDLRTLLPRIPSYLKMNKLNVSKDFIEDFIRAENTFVYQVVFDPRQRCQRPLTPYPNIEKENIQTANDDDDFVKPRKNMDCDFSYAGEVLSTNLSIRLALGNSIDKTPMYDRFLLPSHIPEWSVWSAHFIRGENRIRQKEEKKKATKCGIFIFDSPSKKIQKTALRYPLLEIGESLGDVCHKNNTEDNLSNKSQSQRPRKRIKNEADQSWTIDEMMKMYTSETSENSIITHVSQRGDKIEAKSDTTLSGSGSPIKDNDKKDDLIRMTSAHTSSQSVQSIPAHTPSISNHIVSQPLKISHIRSSVDQTIGRSSYFVKRSASCSNPFKRPCLESPVSTYVTGSTAPKSEYIKKSELVIDQKKPTTLSDLCPIDEDNTMNKLSSLQSSPIVHAVGFKPPGLRRSITK